MVKQFGLKQIEVCPKDEGTVIFGKHSGKFAHNAEGNKLAKLNEKKLRVLPPRSEH